MTTEIELSKQSIPINKILKHSVDWVIRVLVIRKGSVISYKNARHEGTYQTIIVVDDEGTKLQATLFNQQIDLWKDFLKTNKSYYIAKGQLDPCNPNYTSVHKEVELSITDTTIIKETDHGVSTDKFSDGFVSLEHAEKLPNGAILDLLCVLVTVNHLIEKGNSKRREIVVTNELMERTTVTLWGDLAEADGAFLEKLKDDQPILALCDVRVSIYKGNFGISTIPVSSVLINPMFQKALDLRGSREVIKAGKNDITNTPSNVMKKTTEVTLRNLLEGTIAHTQESLYKFKAKIVDILNKNEPWYPSCKKCHKKVSVIQDTMTCQNCNIDNAEYEMRYCVRLEVCVGEQRARVILFDAAQNLVGCSIQEYIATTSAKKGECQNYQRLMLIKDKQFNFLVRFDMNNSNPRRSLIAQEIQAIEEEEPIIIAEGANPQTPPMNRGNKSIAQETHVLGDEGPHIVEDVQSGRPQRKRGRKTKEENLRNMNNSNPQRSLIAQEIQAIEEEEPIIIAEGANPQTPPTNRGKKSIAQETHVLGDEGAHIVEDVQSGRPQRKRGRKTKEEYLQMKTNKIKIEAQ